MISLTYLYILLKFLSEQFLLARWNDFVLVAQSTYNEVATEEAPHHESEDKHPHEVNDQRFNTHS